MEGLHMLKGALDSNAWALKFCRPSRNPFVVWSLLFLFSQSFAQLSLL
jgi:hypothetical protein